MSFIEWFIQLVRWDMESYEEDKKIKKDIYVTVQRRKETGKDER